MLSDESYLQLYIRVETLLTESSFNPNWPPHAKFHNGQTMSMGLTLGLLTAYLVWRPVLNTSIDVRDSTFIAALVGSLYWVTGCSGILYPGTKWMDPEFGESSPQGVVFTVHLALTWVGYWMITKGLGAAKATKVT